MDCLRDQFETGVVLRDRYQTVAPLNHGSFGMVFMARDLQSGETVAVKCLTKQAAADDAGFDFAIDDKSEELALHQCLGIHPNIVSLIDSFETDAHVYLVLEFCERGDLYEAIRVGQGPLETEHVRQFMLELVDAVAYMHSKGVYHRDIKPENIFLSKSGAMKLGDFGLATTERWTYEATVGSDRYMSPEQYDSAGAGYSPAQADIWAIGICLLNILFSRNPFAVPTESDPLFLDFSRDKQSLFDVFPSMSQDTYEVIVQCMNLDPNKRSLDGVRRALKSVASFTTDDETPDDFCSTDCRLVASLNREPLRTPSIQSPQVDNGSFPWAKALHASPQKLVRQLSVIRDDESYTEDLFSKSAKSATTADWFSGSAQTPSTLSTLDFSFGASVQSFQLRQLGVPAGRPRNMVSPMAGSLPITMSRPRQSALSTVFGRKDEVSKSWSDMWDEDFEAEEEAKKLQSRMEMNARTWSQDSQKPVVKNVVDDDEDTPRVGLSPATTSAVPCSMDEVPSIDSALSALSSKDIDEDLGADGFFFHDVPPSKEQQDVCARYSPPPKRGGNVDKWAALGERRRAVAGDSAAAKPFDISLKTGRSLDPGLSLGSGFGSLGHRHGVTDLDGNSQHTSFSLFNHSLPSPSSPISPTTPPHGHGGLHGRGNYSNSNTKDRVKECPWSSSKGRERALNWNVNWRKEKRHAFGDVGWVGGQWQEARS